MQIQTITPQQLFDVARQESARQVNVEIIDVRTPAEYQEARVPGARNVPLDEFDPAVLIRQRGASQEPLFVICQHGIRSWMACEVLTLAGMTHVVNVEGGTQAWADAGLPLLFQGHTEP